MRKSPAPSIIYAIPFGTIVAPTSDNPPIEFSFRTRQNDWEDLKTRPTRRLNAVIIGGGIVGAGLLREFCLRGISDCYVFEKNDFGSGTSGVSSKLIHAGIRYLEQSWERLKKGRFKEAVQNFLFVLQASNERKILHRIAPHLVIPKPIYLVIAESDQRSLLSVAAGVWLYYCMQLLQGQFFRPPKMVFRKEAMRWMAPDLDSAKVKAIFSFWDSETDDARLVIENLRSAREEGGHALNYVEVCSYEKIKDGAVVTLKNRESGETLTIETHLLINAAGPFVDEVLKREKRPGFRQRRLVDRVAGSHLNVYPALTNESYYVTASDNRLVFVLKRNEDGLVYSRIGTTERPLRAEEPSDDPKATRGEIDYLISLAKEFFPKAKIDDQTLISVDSGIRPLASQDIEHSFQKSREHQIIRDENVYHVVGVKLTDYRRVAVELANLIPWERFHIQPKFHSLSSELRPLRPLPSSPVYENSMEDVAKFTMPLHWDDYYFRRRGLAPQFWAKTEPDRLKRLFEEMSRIMDWDESRQEAEIRRVEK